MFRIESPDIKKLERDLQTLAKDAIPFATRKTLTDSAFAAQKIARADVASRMTLRNRWTLQSIRVEMAKSLNISRQASAVGSTVSYMEDQEFGATKHKRGKYGVSLSTSYSAGQGEKAPRTKLPRRPNQLANIRLAKRARRSHSKKQRNLVLIKQAAESGSKFVFLELERTRGVFKVVGGKRNPRIKMVHDMTRSSVTIPANPWLRPAFDEAARMLPAFYADALRYQLRRRNLLG